MNHSIERRRNIDDQHPVLQTAPLYETAFGRYHLSFARTPETLDAAMRLRFEVFNLELGEGLATSFGTMRDEDEYDAQCHHLIVSERTTGAVIGTYRMQTREMAERGIGFYSDSEYDLAQVPPGVLDEAVELGRACVLKPHRNGRVLYLLWRGLAAYTRHTQKRYLFGCCSLTSQDPDEGKHMMDYLRANGYIYPCFQAPPRSGMACYPPDYVATRTFDVKVPRLFRTYLNYGARVCGPPVIDRQFKTIDFLVIMDLKHLDPDVQKIFFE